jgi:hypothetical protein
MILNRRKKLKIINRTEKIEREYKVLTYAFTSTKGMCGLVVTYVLDIMQDIPQILAPSASCIHHKTVYPLKHDANRKVCEAIQKQFPEDWELLNLDYYRSEWRKMEDNK